MFMYILSTITLMCCFSPTFVILYPCSSLLFSYFFYIFSPMFLLLFHKGLLDSLYLSYGVLFCRFIDWPVLLWLPCLVPVCVCVCVCCLFAWTKPVTGLTKELVDHDQRQIEELLPVLQKHLGEISQALTNCLHVKDLIQEWYVQVIRVCMCVCVRARVCVIQW